MVCPDSRTPGCDFLRAPGSRSIIRGIGKLNKPVGRCHRSRSMKFVGHDLSVRTASDPFHLLYTWDFLVFLCFQDLRGGCGWRLMAQSEDCSHGMTSPSWHAAILGASVTIATDSSPEKFSGKASGSPTRHIIRAGSDGSNSGKSGRCAGALIFDRSNQGGRPETGSYIQNFRCSSKTNFPKLSGGARGLFVVRIWTVR